MTQPTPDYLKEARRLARAAGLFFTQKADEFKVYRKTAARVVYLGKRSNPAGLFSFIKRCAVTK